MTEIFTAKTVEEAKAMAAEKFGKNINEIKFEVIEEAKKGLLGGKVFARDAKVKATFEEISVANEEKTAENTVSEPETAVQEEIVEKVVETVETVSEKAEPVKSEEIAKPEKSEPVKAEKPHKSEEFSKKAKTENIPEPEDDLGEEAYSLDNFTLIEDESLLHPKVKIAKDYITSIFRAMDVDADYKVYQNETGAVINIESDNNGTIIGKRGETLDSLQYLCSIIANKGDKDYFRITIDCLGYRTKRKETLEQLAAKIAKSVLRTGRQQPLEPMNPYERRVIHSAISKIDGVSSRSIGEEPYRKIIISSNNPRNNDRRRRNGRPHDGKGGGGRRNDRRPKNNNREYERKSIDLSTSFEKDYKKPKPEDDIAGGLYGKIEL